MNPVLVPTQIVPGDTGDRARLAMASRAAGGRDSAAAPVLVSTDRSGLMRLQLAPASRVIMSALNPAKSLDRSHGAKAIGKSVVLRVTKETSAGAEAT